MNEYQKIKKQETMEKMIHERNEFEEALILSQNLNAVLVKKLDLLEKKLDEKHNQLRIYERTIKRLERQGIKVTFRGRPVTTGAGLNRKR